MKLIPSFSKAFALVLIGIGMLSSASAFAQKIVRGTVSDETGPLAGVSVIQVGTLKGVVTNLDGQYEITLPDGAELQFSCIGYANQIVAVGNSSVVDVKLLNDTTLLDEVVVMAYGGTQRRSKMTNSVATVKEDVLSSGMHSNPAQALSGAVAGLAVQQTSGDPGATPTVILRGGTNLDGTGSPLVIVDGQIRGSMSDINPNDIESMEVMKDAGATAIYGARANNGVLLITTKKGKEGVASINFGAKVGLNFYNYGNYQFCGAEDYLTWMRNAYWVSSHIYQDKAGNWVGYASPAFNGAQPYGTGNSYFDADGNVLDGNINSGAVWSPMVYSDQYAFLLKKGWMKMKDPLAKYDSAYDQEIIFKEYKLSDAGIRTPAISQDYNINVSGGNEKGHYYAGIGYNNSEGSAVANWYKRLTFVLNADYKIRKWLTSYSSFNFADAKWYGISSSSSDPGNYFSRLFTIPPTFRGVNENGDLLIGVRGTGDANPLVNLSQYVRDNNTDKFTMNQSFKFDLAKDFYLKVSALWYYNMAKYESFNKDQLSNVGPMYDTTRSSSAEEDRTLDQTYNAILNYSHDFTNMHHLGAMLGFEYYDSYNKGFSASGSGAPTDDFMDLQFTSTEAGKRNIDSWHSRKRIMSTFGTVNYDYQGKYLLSAVFRYDGYSILAEQNRWGFFPGVSAGWVLSKEDFMSNITNVMNFAKLRMSYGTNGNVSGIGNYYVQGAYGSSKYAGNTAFLLTALPNLGLRWERSNTFEVGFDTSFLENKINFNITFYNRLTEDKLADLSLPSHSGISAYRTNNGSFRNSGVEMEFFARIFDKQDFKWNIGVNAAYNMNKIVSLPFNGLENNRQGAVQAYGPDGKLIWVGGYQEGQRPGEVYAFKSLGLYKNADDIPANWIDMSTGNNGSNNRFLYGTESWKEVYNNDEIGTGLPLQPGDVKFQDVNGDNVLDNYDIVRIGNTTPTWTGGITTDLTYKCFTLKVQTDFALGHVITDTKTPWILGCMQGVYGPVDLVKNTWTPENPNAKYPTYNWADQLGPRNYARNSSMWIYKGDYLALRNVSLVYHLPKKYASLLKMTALDLGITGQNLGYLTAAKNVFSPEYGASGWGGYALPRTLIFSVNVTF